MTEAGERTNLRPQSLAVLRCLAARPGELVPKDDLIAEAWGDINVSDDSLTQCISDIRKVIGDSAREIIRTIPRRGYVLSLGSGMAQKVSNSAPTIRYVTSEDGTRIAWTEVGRGVPLLKTPSWITNIETEHRRKMHAPFIRRVSARARTVSFDQRGSSLSGPLRGPITHDNINADIRAVADAAGLDRFLMFGPSQGLSYAIDFAARNPDRVLGIIGRGGFARGWLATGDPAQAAKYEASRKMIELGWHDENPEYRRFFTARLFPDAGRDIAREYDELQRLAVDSASMLENLDFWCRVDVSEQARQLRCPVLLLHSRGDRATPFASATELAALIPQSELVPLEGDNHMPIPGTPGFEHFMAAIEGFLDRFSDLTPVE
jgi:pimeloyl-ACP methyl ester carboxylesterase